MRTTLQVNPDILYFTPQPLRDIVTVIHFDGGAKKKKGLPNSMSQNASESPRMRMHDENGGVAATAEAVAKALSLVSAAHEWRRSPPYLGSPATPRGGIGCVCVRARVRVCVYICLARKCGMYRESRSGRGGIGV